MVSCAILLLVYIMVASLSPSTFHIILGRGGFFLREPPQIPQNGGSREKWHYLGGLSNPLARSTCWPQCAYTKHPFGIGLRADTLQNGLGSFKSPSLRSGTFDKADIALSPRAPWRHHGKITVSKLSKIPLNRGVKKFLKKYTYI